MKKIFFFFLFAVISYTVFAQSASEHLTFKGVPINGTLNEFVSKLKQKGLAHIGTEEGIAMLKGDFAAYWGNIHLIFHSFGFFLFCGVASKYSQIVC